MASSSSSSSSSLFDDSEWELANADDIDSGSDAEWVITGDDIYFVPGRSMSGVFVTFRKKTVFIHFQPNHLFPPCDSCIPPSFSVSSSCDGLLLSRGPWSSYCVSNPSAGANAFLPKPPRAHRPDSPLAIAVKGPTYYVTCAVAGAGKGAYSFATFSSSTGTWNSSREEFLLGRIIPNSGVSCLGFAYWRTESQMVAGYDVIADKARALVPPVKLSEVGDRWQLGRVGENLCCVLVTSSNFEVYRLGVGDQWVLLCSVGTVVSEEGEWDGGEPIVCRKLPQAFKFESNESEVVLVVDGKFVVLGLENRKMRILQYEKPVPDCYAAFVPYIDNADASVNFSVDRLPAK